MSTIGHPLSDISNLVTPYYTARLDPRRSVNVHPGFLPRATRGLPTVEEITALYFSVVESAPPKPASSSLELTLQSSTTAAAAGSSPADRARELLWAQAFNIFRLSAICQGIAARQASRQASSEQARRYAAGRTPLAEFAWELVQTARSGGETGEGAGGSGGQGRESRL